MKLSARDLEHLSARTIAHYDHSAHAFWEATRHHDVSQNYAALLDAIEAPPPFTLLDLGCGPGRDLGYFKSLGHEAAERAAVACDRVAEAVDVSASVTASQRSQTAARRARAYHRVRHTPSLAPRSQTGLPASSAW